ncbi:MAG: hypothetical protein U0414_43770 [Polyangiaceae bacterium]
MTATSESVGEEAARTIDNDLSTRVAHGRALPQSITYALGRAYPVSDLPQRDQVDGTGNVAAYTVMGARREIRFTPMGAARGPMMAARRSRRSTARPRAG